MFLESYINQITQSNTKGQVSIWTSFFDEKFVELGSVSSRYEKITVMGDFNMDFESTLPECLEKLENLCDFFSFANKKNS